MREITVKDFNEVVDGLRQKGYDVDSMKIFVSNRHYDGHFSMDTVWGMQVVQDQQSTDILLEV